MNPFAVSQVDLAIIVGYLLVVFFIGFVIARKTVSAQDLFLAGRSLGWGAIGFSLFASNISGATIIGLSGQAYRSGISISNHEWMATIILVGLSFFFLPFLVKNKLSTIPEYLELRYNRFVRQYFSMVTIFLNIVVDMAGSLYAGALILNVFFPEFSLWQICAVLAFIGGIYTATGGLGAVVYTDILQAIVILTGSSILLFAVLGQYDFSWSQAIAQVPEGFMSVIRPIGDETLPWTGLCIGLPVLGFYYWGLNQQIAQRFLGAKNIQHARRGALLGGLLKLPVLFLLVIPGVFAISLFPELENFDMVFPTLVSNLLPPGVVGIVLAGIIAAIMSSIDSALNASSTLIVMDFIKTKKPDTTPVALAKYGRIITVLLMLFAALWAPMIGTFEGLFSYLIQVISYAVPPVVAIYFLGICWSRGNEQSALLTLVIGHTISIIFLYLSSQDALPLHFTVIAGLLMIISCCIYLITALLTTTPPKEKLEGVTWRFRAYDSTDEEEVWYESYKVHGFVLLVLTGWLVITFW